MYHLTPVLKAMTLSPIRAIIHLDCLALRSFLPRSRPSPPPPPPPVLSCPSCLAFLAGRARRVHATYRRTNERFACRSPRRFLLLLLAGAWITDNGRSQRKMPVQWNYRLGNSRPPDSPRGKVAGFNSANWTPRFRTDVFQRGNHSVFRPSPSMRRESRDRSRFYASTFAVWHGTSLTAARFFPSPAKVTLFGKNVESVERDFVPGNGAKLSGLSMDLSFERWNVIYRFFCTAIFCIRNISISR